MIGLKKDTHLNLTRSKWLSFSQFTALFMGLVLLLTGCGKSGTSIDFTSANNFLTSSKPQIIFPVKNQDEDVVLTDNFRVKAINGILEEVNLVNDAGLKVEGVFDKSGEWVSNEKLGFGRHYTVEAKAQGVTGVQQQTIQFQMKTPSNKTKPYLLVGDGEVVGIGQPVAVKFDEPIPNRKKAQSLIHIKTEPKVEGAFYWISPTEVRWRPEHYWQPGTKINVAVDVYGKDLGNGLYGEDNVKASYSIGDRVISIADDNTKMISVYKNHKLLRTMPTSMGTDEMPTNQGIYIIAERYPEIVMDSSTFGIPINSPKGYKTKVQYATRMSYSGIFVHSAPWSLAQQGNTNTSHGCLNVSPANAKWFMELSKRGDLVEVRNTKGGILPGTDGLGDWNIPWSVWEKGNA